MTTDTISQRVFSYRKTRPDDLPFLLQLRKECGWGELKIKLGWESPDVEYIIFTLSDGENVEDIGMGGWVLNKDDDLETACRETGAVHIGKLDGIKPLPLPCT